MKVEIINGIVELSDNKGSYLNRICEDAVYADVKEFDVVVVKRNGNVDLYDDSGQYYRTITNNATSATFTPEGISVIKENGEEKIYVY